jgi:SAM-dependent methyltransferase
VTLKHHVGRQVIPRLPVTRHVVDNLRFELNGLWVRSNNRINPAYLRTRRLLASGHDLSVNVACGGTAKPAWVNLDLYRHANVTLRFDCRTSLPLRPASAARIRCEHFLEHLDRIEESPLFLRSCLRCLRPGGVLRIVVPDAERYLRAYQSGPAAWKLLGWNLDALPPGFASEIDIINHVFRQGSEHRYAYDFATLAACLRDAGFAEIHRMDFGRSVDPLLGDDAPGHRSYSLYADAVKGEDDVWHASV